MAGVAVQSSKIPLGGRKTIKDTASFDERFLTYVVYSSRFACGPMTEFPLNGVAIGEGLFQAVEGVGHQGLRWGVRAQAASGPQQVMRYLTRA